MFSSGVMHERVGGFCTHFGHVVDMDMWFRIGLVSKVVSLPRPFAMYRFHSASDTGRCMVTGKNIAESVELTQVNTSAIRAAHPELGIQRGAWRASDGTGCGVVGLETRSAKLFRKADSIGRWAWKLAPNSRRLRFYITSWARTFLGRKRHTA